MARKPKVAQEDAATVDNELDAIEQMLKDAYAERKKGSPRLQWGKVRKSVKTAGVILMNALVARKQSHENWLAKHEGEELPSDNLYTCCNSVKGWLDEAWEILDNKDGKADTEKDIRDLIRLKQDVIKRQAEAHKLSGLFVSKAEFMKEIEVILRIMNREIDKHANDRDLAADIKNGIAKGLARRRGRQADTGAGDEEVDAAEPSGVRGGDGPVQDVAVAEDAVHGTVEAGA